MTDPLSEAMRASDNAILLDGLLDLAAWRAKREDDPVFMDFEFTYLRQTVLNRMNNAYD